MAVVQRGQITLFAIVVTTIQMLLSQRHGYIHLIYVTDDRPYMIIVDLIRPFRSYMVRPYMV